MFERIQEKQARMHGPEHTTDLTDIRLAQAGDRAAFGRLVDAHLPMTYRLSIRWLGTTEDAEDASQEAFLRVWEHLRFFDTQRSFAAWLTTIVTRICFDRLRKRQRSPFRRFHAESSTDFEPSASGPDPQDTLVWHDLATIVKDMLSRLPPTQRVVFALRDLEDLEVDEVSEITGLSTSSVKTNLSYARRTIRTILAKEYHMKDVMA